MNVLCKQVNLRKSSLATGLFSHELSSEPTIGLVTEPYTAFNKVVGKPLEYQVFPELPSDSPPRAALYIPRNIKCIGMPQLSNADCQVAQIFLSACSILIVSAYLDINHPPVPVWLEEVMEFVQQKQLGIVLSIDTNSHSQLYGPNTNHRGAIFEQFIIQNSLWVENRGDVPTFQTIRAESFIDVTLTREVKAYDWYVDTSYNASDHNTICFKLSQVVVEPPKEIRSWHTADWAKFNTTLASSYFGIPKTITTMKLDKMVSHMYSELEAALDAVCAPIKIKIKFKGANWFNDQLKKLKDKTKKQFKIAQRINSEEEWSKYNSIHSRFRYKCRKAKATTWRKFVTETKNENKMAKLARIAQHKDRTRLHSLKKEDGTFTNPGNDTLSELAKTHFPLSSSEPPYEKYDSTKKFCPHEDLSMYEGFLNTRLVTAALEGFKPMKAAGPDGIKPIVFKHLPIVFIQFLTVIYAACLKLHYTPKLWWKATVVFLPKPGKPNYILGKYFRPIVLSNFFLKGLERIITWRMEFLLDKYYPIHSNQHGFTKG